MSADDRQRVDVLLDLGRHGEALPLLEGLLAAEPDSAGLHDRRARALHGLGRYDEALGAAGRVAALAPQSATGHRQAAVTLLRLGRTPEALAAAHEAVRREPGLWHHHALLAQVAAEDPRTLRLAWDAAMHTVHLAPDDAEAHFTVGFVATHRRDNRTAIEAYRRALAIDPAHATAIHNLALLESRGDVGRIADGVVGALRLDPQRDDFHRTLDDVTRRTVVRVWVSTAVACFLGSTAALLTDPRQPVAVGVVALVVALAAWWGFTVRSLPVPARRHATDRLRSDRGLQLLVGGAVVGLVVLAVAAAFPGTGAVANLALLLTLLLGLPGLVVLQSRRGGRRSR